MARQVKHTFKRRTPLGKPPVYPWPKWTKGTIWKIKQGVDFFCTLEGMRQTLHSHARGRDLSVSTEIVSDTEIIFQFRED